MDSDDNDFQCQNFHLIGEDNNKFLPNLHPFHLPKFDVDEHLQDHLRFDNLVETEELLGIQGHGNNWIEEFSPGGSRIELSSSAVESCSISRHNNVWSEATSSESVEMLLKSVGEDKMIDKKPTIKKSDAHVGLNDLDGQNESLLKQNDSENSKMIDIVHKNIALSPDKRDNVLSGLDEDALGVQPQVEGTFQASENQKRQMETSSLSRKFNSERNTGIHECSIKNELALWSDYGTEKSSVIAESLCEENQNKNPVQNALVQKCDTELHDSVASIVAAQDLDRTSQGSHSSISTCNLVIVPGKLNTPTKQMVEECRESDISEKLDPLTGVLQKEHIRTVACKITDQPSQSFEVSSGVFSAKGSTFLEPPVGSLVLLNKRCNEPELSSNTDVFSEAITCQAKVLIKGLDNDRITPSMESTFIGLDRNPENSDEISTGDIARLPCVMDGFKNCDYEGAEQLPKPDGSHAENNLLVETFCIFHGCKERKLDILSELMEEKQVLCPKVQLSGNSNSDVENMSDLKMHSSTDMSCEMPIKLLSNNDASMVSEEIGGALSAGQRTSTPAILDCLSSQKLVQEWSGKVASELNHLCKTPEATAVTKENPSLSLFSGRAEPNCDISIVMEKMDSASSGGQKTAVSTTMIQGDSVNVNLHSGDHSTFNCLLQPEDMSTVDEVEKQKEEIAPLLPLGDFIEPIKKAPEFSETILRDLELQASKESVIMSDPAFVDCILAGDTFQDKEGDSCLKLVADNGSKKSHQSEDGLSLAVYVVDGQKEDVGPGSSVSDPFHLDENEMKISRDSSLLVSNGFSDTQITGDSLYSCTKSSAESFPVVGSKFASHELEAESANPNSFDQICGSECVNCHQEDNRMEQDQMYPVSGDQTFETSETRINSNKVRCNSHGPKESAAAEGGSNFTSESLPIRQSNTTFHNFPAENIDPNLFDQNCSSAAVISCCKHSEAEIYQKGKREKQDIVELVSDDQPCETSETVRYRSRGSKEIAAAEDERNFTFESLPVTTGTAASHKLEAESADQTCGSPTVISFSEHSQVGIYQNGNREPQDQMDTVSDDQSFEFSETRMDSNIVICSAHGSVVRAAAEHDKSFTFEVGALPDLCGSDTDNDRKPSACMESFELPQISKENSEGHLLELKEGEPHGTLSKTLDEDKPSEVSGCLTEGRSSSLVEARKETQVVEQIEIDVNPCSTSSKSFGTISSNREMEMPHYSYIKSGIKASCSPTVQTCSDLNSSVSTVLFHQPFKDIQQVQLRAQIFVYGSLIQSIPPDEACMISAFGGTDGGRSLWEGLYRISAERYQNQKSPFSSCETTPSHCYPAVHVKWSSGLEANAPGTPSHSVSKTLSTSMLNSAVHVLSPLWNSSTHDESHSNIPRVAHQNFNQALSLQCSDMNQYTGNNSPWQTPRPGPWILSSQNTIHESTAQFKALPITETVQITSVRGSSIADSHTLQFASPPALLTTNVSIETQRKVTTPGNSKNTSGQKSRKRKKSTMPLEPLLNIVVSQPLNESPCAGVSRKLPTPSVALSKPTPTKVASDGLFSAATHTMSPTHYQIISGGTKQRVIFSEEACSKIEQAKLQAEDAAALAASAATHSQRIWTQLVTQKRTGLVSETDEKLASAAVAAAAAASVAKAAAAAARVASDAALQAKLMADEAVSSARAGNRQQVSETGLPDVEKNVHRLAPVSVSMGKDNVNGSSSIISAAQEAARRRLEATSAATKRAENLESIVKAAELAAEAVSQAGIIVAMGEPLPFTLSELVEAGMEGHWRVHRATSGEHAKVNSQYQDGVKSDGAGNNDKTIEQFKLQSPDNNRSPESSEEGRNQGHFASDKLDKGYVHESDNVLSSVPTNELEKDHVANNQEDVSIREGSLVEVISDDDGLRRVWFSANVIEVKDGKAYICYNDLSSEGTGKLMKWVSLKGEGNIVPRIRLAHPMTTAKYEGLRKRRRAASGNCAWAVGDRVDARMHDGWCEGIVTEKSQEDETQLTVQFSDGGDSSVIRDWDLRPSLIWKDGQWIEWSRPEKNVLQESDTPNEKRQKIGGVEARVCPEVDGKVIGKVSKNLPIEDPRKPSETRPLAVSAKDKVFSVGNNGREVENSNACKLRRMCSQKEGSRVVIGVPKPGKRRKFMEVSKHYVADKAEKKNGECDPIKFAKYLMPQVSRVWKNSTKADPKGKIVDHSNSKVLKAVKPSMQTRSTTEKGNSSNAASSDGVDTGHGSLPSARATFRNEHANMEKKSMEVCTFNSTGGKLGNPHVDASLQPVPSVGSSKKSSSAVHVGRGFKGMFTTALDMSTRGGESYENAEKVASDAHEPRRSIRRIQPTSRLLEGLQSSLTISKLPSFSHEKGAKSQHRGASSKGNSQS